MRLRPHSRGLLSIILALGTAISAVARASGPPEIPEQFKDEPAVVLSESDHYDISKDSAVWRHTHSTLFRERPSVGRATVELTGSHYMRLEKITAKVVKPDGTTSWYGTDDFVEISGVDASGYFSDIKTYVHRFDDLRAGDVLHVETVTKIVNLLMCPVIVFQGMEPVLRRDVTVQGKAEAGFSFHVIGESGVPAVEESDDGKKRTLKWSVRDIPAFVREDRSVPAPPPAVLLRFAGRQKLGADLDLDSWDSVARWYNELSGDCVKPTTEISRLAERLQLNDMSPVDAVRAAYEYVRSDVRYVAVEVGLSRWKPRKCDKIADVLYGDCKDKATLFISLLRPLGIDANYALVRTRGMVELPDELPSIKFNHAIAAVDLADSDETLFLDPTCSDCPFGILPDGDQGAFALVVDGESGRPVRLPDSEPSDNRIDHEIAIVVDENGDATFEHGCQANGLYTMVVRNRFKGDRADANLYGSDHDVSVDKLDKAGIDEMGTELGFNVAGRVNGLAEEAGGFLIVNPNLVDIGGGAPDSDADRKTAYNLGAPRARAKSVTIAVPQGWKLTTKTAGPVELNAPYLAYRYHVETVDGGVRISSELVVKQRVVAPSEFENLAELLREVNSYERTEIVFSNRD